MTRFELIISLPLLVFCAFLAIRIAGVTVTCLLTEFKYYYSMEESKLWNKYRVMMRGVLLVVPVITIFIVTMGFPRLEEQSLVASGVSEYKLEEYSLYTVFYDGVEIGKAEDTDITIDELDSYKVIINNEDQKLFIFEK